MAATFEIYQDDSDQYDWRLKSGNNQVIATSGEGCVHQPGARKGIEALKRDVRGASVKDVPR